jgi:hypothetical protein
MSAGSRWGLYFVALLVLLAGLFAPSGATRRPSEAAPATPPPQATVQRGAGRVGLSRPLHKCVSAQEATGSGAMACSRSRDSRSARVNCQANGRGAAFIRCSKARSRSATAVTVGKSFGVSTFRWMIEK